MRIAAQLLEQHSTDVHISTAHSGIHMLQASWEPDAAVPHATVIPPAALRTPRLCAQLRDGLAGHASLTTATSTAPLRAASPLQPPPPLRAGPPFSPHKEQRDGEQLGGSAGRPPDAGLHQPHAPARLAALCTSSGPRGCHVRHPASGQEVREAARLLLLTMLQL